MINYKIVYVDESDQDIKRFQRFSENSFEVIPIKPLQDIKETCEIILDSHSDAIIVDFNLSEQDPKIHYNGDDLVNEILKVREGFPVFIFTSYEDEAISEGEDVNIIYEKSEVSNGTKFLIRVKSQIEKYHHKLSIAEKKLLSLIKESKSRKLNAFEEKEILQLDSLLEKSLDKKHEIPDKLRMINESSGLVELLKKVDDLAKKLGEK